MTRSEFQEGPATDHYHLGLGTDGEVPQSVSVIGPFSVTFDTPDLGADPIPLTDLSAGLTVVKAWAVFSTRWNNLDDASLFIVVADPTDPTTFKELVQYDALTATLPVFGDLALVESPPGPAVPNRSAVILQPCKLSVGLSASGSPASAGACDIYALIGESS